MTTATTAPTPDEVHSLAARLEHCAAKWGKQNALSLEAYSAVKMLRRLLAKVERLESERITRIDQQTKLSLRIVDLQSEVDRLRAAADSPTTNQATNYSENYSAAWQINALTTRKVEAIRAREPYVVTGVVLSQTDGRACIVNQSAVRWFHGPRDFWGVLHPDSTSNPLSDEQIDAIAEGMPGGLDGFLKHWGWRQFARKILDLRAMPTWEPQFDVMAPGQEELAIQFCAEIAGPRGKPGRNPDPVRLLEMAQALYKAEADAHMVDRSPNLQEPPVDKAANLQERPTSPIAIREVVADGPVRVTRLHLSTEGRAALTTTATGPLPGTNR